MKEIILRKMSLKDLEVYYDLTNPSRKYHDFNGPYYKKETDDELKKELLYLKKHFGWKLGLLFSMKIIGDMV